MTEAIEMADGRWGLGVQWHPEANDKSRLFAALSDAARGYAALEAGAAGPRGRGPRGPGAAVRPGAAGPQAAMVSGPRSR